MSTIYLIRHGEISQSQPRRFIGGQDLPLTEKGREQITRLTEFLTARPIDKILTSPLLRCVESARILSAQFELDAPEEVADLREIGLGSWEGLTVDQVRRRFPGDYEARGRDLAQFRPAGGESFTDLLHRAWPTFESAAGSADERLAIIAHAGVNRVLLCRILEMALDKLFRLEQHYGCVNIVHLKKTGYRVESINTCPLRMVR